MKVKIDDLKRVFLLVALLSYLGVFSFIGLMLTGGRSDDAFAENVSGSLLNQIVGVSLFLSSFLLLYHSSHFSLIRAAKQSFWWLVLIGYFALSISWSYAPQVSFRRLVAFITLLTVAYCLVEFFTARSLLTLLATAIGILAIAGLLYALLQPDKAFISEGIRAQAFKGIYFDKNGGARVYAYAVLLIVGLQLYKTRFYQVLLAILLLCILISQSATAVVIVFFGLLLSGAFNLLHSSSLQLNFLRFFLLLAGLVIGGSLIYQLYDLVLLWLGRDPTLTNRVIIWALLDPYIQAEWLRGYGFGGFWSSSAVSEFVARWGFIGNAHSGYYEALLHGGIIALVLVFIIIFHTLWRLSKHYIYSVNSLVASMLLPFVLIQGVVNYIGYLIINHNSFDMFIFSIIYFIASRGVSRHDPEQS